MAKYSTMAVANYIVTNRFKSSKKIATEVAAYLIESSKTSDINSISRDVLTILDDEDGVVELNAVSAKPLRLTERNEVVKLVKKLRPKTKHVVVNELVDPSVIGGVRLEFPHELLDMTIKYKMNLMKSYSN